MVGETVSYFSNLEHDKVVSSIDDVVAGEQVEGATHVNVYDFQTIL